MNIEDHVAGGTPDFGVRVTGTVVEELQELRVGVLCCG
jgi:hypothetical protein